MAKLTHKQMLHAAEEEAGVGEEAEDRKRKTNESIFA